MTVDRLLAHHLARSADLVAAAAQLPDAALDRVLRPGLVIVWFDGEEPSARHLAEGVVHAVEVWVAAMDGLPQPVDVRGDWPRRLELAGAAFTRIATALRSRDGWDDAFVDALCEPPQAFTYGGAVAHVLSYGGVRREALAGVLAELGAPEPATHADPLAWEMD
ncbi:hypothetical protein [Paraconexibacter sp. AEG42_29]|uniref:hypothetical protein n=1 Tax=Paraconexibacter sp. AEG42_29 TaxID=2997339 RepID=UPI00339D7676